MAEDDCLEGLKKKAPCSKNACLIILIVSATAAAIVISLIATSFADLEYYEIGFKRRKSTGSVDTNSVYTGGRYAVGPDYEFKAFESTAHFVDLTNVAIFTSDRLEVTLSVHFQYFLRNEDLGLLHDTYDLYYAPIVENSALDAIKVEATQYSLAEYIVDRSYIEEKLYSTTRDRLSGTCCQTGCADTDAGCVTGCLSQADCTDADKGFFVTIKYFQMGEIGIPSDVASRRLQNLLLLEETEKQQYVLEAEQVIKETERQVEAIINIASEVTNTATAESVLITAVANANATAIREGARVTGLNNMYTTLNITTTDYKRSLDYLRTVGSSSKVHLSVDFNQLVVGQLNSP